MVAQTLTGTDYISSVTLTNSAVTADTVTSRLFDGIETSDPSNLFRIPDDGVGTLNTYAAPYPTLTFQLVNPVNMSGIYIANDYGNRLDDGVENAVIKLYDSGGNLLGTESMTMPSTSYTGNVTFPSGTTYNAVTSFEVEIQSNWVGTSNSGTTDIREFGLFGEVVPPLCFTAEMLIDTENGPVLAGQLAIGDRVRTYDNGYQPLRFVYKWRSPSVGRNRAIIFEPGTVGNDRPVHVSQEHRFLIDSVRSDLIPAGMNGANDVLIKASLLVNGGDVRFDTVSKSVEYVHLMFDHHELIYCQGSISESWQPKIRHLASDQHLREELSRLFPEFFALDKNSRLPIRYEVGFGDIGHMKVPVVTRKRRALRQAIW